MAHRKEARAASTRDNGRWLLDLLRDKANEPLPPSFFDWTSSEEEEEAPQAGMRKIIFRRARKAQIDEEELPSAVVEQEHEVVDCRKDSLDCPDSESSPESSWHQKLIELHHRAARRHKRIKDVSSADTSSAEVQAELAAVESGTKAQDSPANAEQVSPIRALSEAELKLAYDLHMLALERSLHQRQHSKDSGESARSPTSATKSSLDSNSTSTNTSLPFSPRKQRRSDGETVTARIASHRARTSDVKAGKAPARSEEPWQAHRAYNDQPAAFQQTPEKPSLRTAISSWKLRSKEAERTKENRKLLISMPVDNSFQHTASASAKSPRAREQPVRQDQPMLSTHEYMVDRGWTGP